MTARGWCTALIGDMPYRPRTLDAGTDLGRVSARNGGPRTSKTQAAVSPGRSTGVLVVLCSQFLCNASTATTLVTSGILLFSALVDLADVFRQDC